MQNISIPDKAAAVTPSDSTNQYGLGLYVGTGGNVSLTMAGGGTITLLNIQAGTLLPIEFSQVRATGTTASSIVRFF